VRGLLFTVLLIMGEVFEELGQASHQLVAAADYVQAAFVLMLFQDLMQSAFEFTHDKYLPRIRRTYKLSPFAKQRKFEISMASIQNSMGRLHNIEIGSSTRNITGMVQNRYART
jgi:hypothetical protein